MQPIILYSHPYGPNPWNMVLILEELDIPYTAQCVNSTQVKEVSYTRTNPNGCLPAIKNPSSDTQLWESGAIVEYLLDTYDKQQKLRYARFFPEYYQTKEWPYFQVSRQAPYYSQASWFQRLHLERSRVRLTATATRFAVLDSVEGT